MARRQASGSGIVVLVLFMLLAVWPQGVSAQDKAQGQAAPDASIWSDALAPASIDVAQRWVMPATYRLVSADMVRLDAVLAQAPLETQAGAGVASSGAGETVLELPLPDGTVQRFAVVESPIMAPELAAKYPQIKTYEARGLDDPTAVARLDRTPAGFHAMILSASETVFIDPYLRGNDTLYASYYRGDYGNAYGKQRNELEPLAGPAGAGTMGGVQAAQSGPTLHTYRLALAATGEYTQFHGGTVAGALAAMTTTMNRINGLYRRDLGVQFTLIPNTNLLIYTDPNTDPYTNNNGLTMLGQNQANINTVIGSANYDIGHVFSTGGGGIAGLGVVCTDSVKAQGVTGSPAPVGDPFDIDFVAHEFGHQFIALHTFNDNSQGSCAGNRDGGSAWEPGSGTTIMAYAGICFSQNLQAHSDDLFHAGSIAKINAYVADLTQEDGSACGTSTATGNDAPTVNAAPDFTIPRLTPFTLTGTGSDPNGDALTFTWEELDTGAAANNSLPNTDSDGNVRPIFRTQRPVAQPVRTFPALSSILSGANSNSGEALPAISRSMTFRLTARDGRGGVNDASTSVTVDAGSGPFVVTAPDSAVNWVGGSSQAVTWNVANTNAAPVNCANVNVLFSSDGGQTFPTTLVANTPNDGSQAIAAPGVNTTTGRIKVACANNIFFDIGNADLTVTNTAPEITREPDNQSVTAGATAYFTATAFAIPAPTMQWQVSTDGGTSWTDIPGATDSTLSFTAQAGDNGKQYHAMFTTALGTASTNAATLTVNTVPQITTQPSSQTLKAGQQASFSAAASGSPAPTVQWQVSTDNGATWTNIPGATATTLSFTAQAGDNGKQYHAVFTNVAGPATTNAVTLTVDTTPPVIAPNVVGTLGQNGWYVSNVSVTWNVSDAESAVSSQTGCAAQSVTSDTTGVTFTCQATSTGGTNSQQVKVKRDATQPVLVPTVTPNPVTLNQPATASPNATDATSGIASQSCPAVDTSSTGSKSVTCTATDSAGNTATAGANFQVNIDIPGGGTSDSALYLPLLQKQK